MENDLNNVLQIHDAKMEIDNQLNNNNSIKRSNSSNTSKTNERNDEKNQKLLGESSVKHKYKTINNIDWTSVELLQWILFYFIPKYKIDEKQFQIECFFDKDGLQLSKMSKEDFKQLDPIFYGPLYEEFNKQKHNASASTNKQTTEKSIIKSIYNWTDNDVIIWLTKTFVEDNHIDLNDFQLKNFMKFNGYQLCKTTLEVFQKLDPKYGVLLYNTITELKENEFTEDIMDHFAKESQINHKLSEIKTTTTTAAATTTTTTPTVAYNFSTTSSSSSPSINSNIVSSTTPTNKENEKLNSIINNNCLPKFIFSQNDIAKFTDDHHSFLPLTPPETLQHKPFENLSQQTLIHNFNNNHNSNNNNNNSNHKKEKSNSKSTLISTILNQKKNSLFHHQENGGGGEKKIPMIKSKVDLTTKQANDEIREKKMKNCIHIWQFIRDLLKKPTNESDQCVKWIDESKGLFKVINPSMLTDLWAKAKGRNSITYESMSRGMRHSRMGGYFSKVNSNNSHGKKMVHQFGPRAIDNCDWLKSIIISK